MDPKDYTVIGQRSPYFYYDCALRKVENLSPIATTLQNDIIPFEPAPHFEESCIWHLLKFIKRICEILWMIISCSAPDMKEEKVVAIDHGLYACLMLGRKKGDGFSVADSKMLGQLCDYFEKDPAVSADVVAQLREMQGWLVAVENKAEDHFDPIAKQISQRIRGLQVGQGCVFPGGTRDCFGLYRVTHTAHGYEIQILSRDAALEHGECISVFGKEKMRIGTTFAGLTQEEVSNELWIRTLLGLHISATADSSSLGRLFSRFRDKQVDPTDPRNLGLHSKVSKDRTIATLWSFVQDASGRDSRAAKRSKLRLQIDSLFRYVEELSRQKTVPHLAHTYVREGIQRISQKTLVMLQKQELTQEEQEWLSRELGRVEEELTQQKLNFQEWIFIETPGKMSVIPEMRKASQVALAPPNADFAPPVQASRRLKTYHPVDATYQKTVFEMGKIDASNLLPSLKRMAQEAFELQDPISAQHRLMDICFATPFQPYEGPTYQPRKNPEDIWTKLSAEEWVEASELFFEMGKKIDGLAKDSDTLLPDRVLALFKLDALIHHLITLNRAVTGIDARYDHQLEGVNFGWFITGNADRSLYRLHRKEEQTIVEQLHHFFECWKWVTPGRDGPGFPRSYELPDTPQKKHLIGFEKILNPEYHKIGVTAKRISQWGRPVQQPLLKGAMYGVKLSGGHHGDDGKPSKNFGPSWMTQEAMMDDSMRVLRLALSNWLEDAVNRDDGKKEQLAKTHNQPLELEKDEILDLLLSMESKTVIWNLLGLIQQHPSLLLNGDICSIVELLFLTIRGLEHAFKKDASLKSFLREFFDKQIAGYIKRKEIGPALFLIHLNHTIRKEFNVVELADYSKKIHQWMLEAFHPESDTAPYRYALLENYLLLFEKRAELSEEEIRNLIIFNGYFESYYGDPTQFDPVQKDRIHRLVRAWAPAMEKALQNDELLQHTLDKVCDLNDVALPLEAWTGSFPNYSAEDVELNLLTGELKAKNSNDKLSQLAPDILRDELFKKLFPHFFKLKPRVAAHLHSDLSVFAFKDTFGQEVRIEVTNSQVFYYRRHLNNGSWLKAVDQIEGLEFSLPACFADQQLYVSVDSSREVWSYDRDGKVQFAFHFDHEVDPETNKPFFQFKSVDDVRDPQAVKQNRQMVPFNPYIQPGFVKLLSLDSSQNLILWHSNGQLEEVEFFRYGLKFAWRENKLHCTSPSYEGYTIQLHPTHDQRLGLAAGVVLEKPGHPNLILLPPEKGQFQSLTLRPSTPNSTCELIAKLWENPDFPKDELPDIELLWKAAHDTAAHLWVLEQGEELRAAPGQKPAPLWFEVLRHAIKATYKADCHPLRTAKRALHELTLILPGSLSDEEIKEMVKQLIEIAKASTKEGISLVLQALLILRDKCSNRLINAVEKSIAKMGIEFCASGKHIEVSAALNQNQLALLVNCLRKYEPDFFSSFGIFLVDKKLSETKVSAEYPLLFKASSIVPADIVKYASLLKTTFEPDPYLFLNKEPRELTKAFPQLYTVAQKEAISSDEFEKMRLTLQMLSASEMKRNPVLGFLEMLFELRIEDPDFKLPALPGADPSDFNKWLEDVVKKVERSYGKREVPPEPPKKPLKPAIFHHIPDEEKALENLSIEKLEEKLRTAPAKSAPVALHALQPNDSLFDKNALEGLFEDVYIKPWNNVGPIARENGADEPVVAHFKKELRDEMKAYENSLSPKGKLLHKIRDGKDKEVQQLLTTKRDSLAKDAESKRQRTMELFTARGSELIASEQRAGYRRTLVWDEVLVASLEDNLEQLIVQSRQEVDLKELKERVRLYLEVETKHRFANFCLDEFEAMMKEGTALISSSGENIYEMLQRCRAYDPKEHVTMLTVEYVLGYLCTENQLKIISGFVTEPSSIYRAITGAGKTSTILLLAALMKADGQNLMTLKFLDSLLPENQAHFQKIAGGILKKRITPLQYSMKTPLIHRHFVEEKEIKESTFKRMYRQLLITILDKGCLIVGRRSQPLLEAKFISYAYKMANLPPNQAPPEEDLDHICWLAKILLLLRERQECIYDEHDKFLHPKDEIHLRIGKGEPIPAFLWKTPLEIFDSLLKNEKLGLRRNIHEELTVQERTAVLENAAVNLAQEWVSKEPKLEKFKPGLIHYLEGESEDVLTELEKICSPEMLDALALTKDMLLIFLPLTLSRAGNKKYIRSEEDGVSVIGCEAVDKPREGSQFEEMRELICYFLQYYYQEGVSLAYFKQWIARLIRDGFMEMEQRGLEKLSETRIDEVFRDYFPNESLEGLLEKDILRLHREIKESPALTLKFLEVLLPQLRMSGRKITIDAHNDVSMSKAAGGTSATLGCVVGLHRNFKVQKDADNVRGKMLSRFCNRLPTTQLLTYDPANPKGIIPSLLEKNPRMGIVIDGAGALWGVDPKESAQQLKCAKGLDAVGYFDKAGRYQIEGAQNAPLQRRGQVYTHAQSRGANVKLATSLPSVLTANGRSDLEAELQHEGRLRKDQPMKIAVPINSGMKTAADLLDRSAVVEGAEDGDLAYRSKKHEQRDILRSEMMTSLLPLFAEKKFEEGLALFNRYSPAEILVSENKQNWDKPGSYYAQHKHIEKKSADGVESLKQRQQKYKTQAEKLDLAQSVEKIQELNYDSLTNKVSKWVFPHDSTVLGTEVEVETEEEAEKQGGEISIEVEDDMETIVDTQEETPYYLLWQWHETGVDKWHSSKKLNQAYDEGLHFSENFLPTKRNGSTAPIYQRSPHDLKQNKLHYVSIYDRDRNYGDMKVINNICLATIDIYEAHRQLDSDDSIYMLYDTKLRRFVSKYPNVQFSPAAQKKLTRLIAQARFEDGQYDTYDKEEMEALRTWLKEKSKPSLLEKYFTEEVLKNQPEKRQRYRHSPLKELFEELSH